VFLKNQVEIRSSKNITLASDVDNVILDNTLIASSDLSCLPKWLQASAKANAVNGSSGKVANLNAIGNARNNEMTGNDGNNQLSGLNGNDKLSGGIGKDILIGGQGSDELNGNQGQDIFRYLNQSDSIVGARDAINDFSVDDKLDLKRLDADINKAGNQAFSFISNAGFNNVAGQLRFDNGILQADTNGDGAADFEVELVGLTNLSAANIVL
jgi:Ca2+-binding RTX toxin-like protein